MKRELRRLPHRPHKQQQRRRRQRPLPYRPRLRRRDNIGYDKRPRSAIQQYNPNQQPHIPDARGDKRLLSRLRRRPALPPKPYQQIRPQPHQLPRDIQKQQIIGKHKRQHSRPEQRLRREIPPKPRIPPHILQRIHLHQKRHKSNQPQHHHRQPVNMNPPPNHGIPHRQPLHPISVIIHAAPQQIRRCHRPQRQPPRHSRDRRKRALARQPSAAERHHHKRPRAEPRNKPSQIHAPNYTLSLPPLARQRPRRLCAAALYSPLARV